MMIATDEITLSTQHSALSPLNSIEQGVEQKLFTSYNPFLLPLCTLSKFKSVLNPKKFLVSDDPMNR
jgi:hypothetical protein